MYIQGGLETIYLCISRAEWKLYLCISRAGWKLYLCISRAGWKRAEVSGRRTDLQGEVDRSPGGEGGQGGQDVPGCSSGTQNGDKGWLSRCLDLNEIMLTFFS